MSNEVPFVSQPPAARGTGETKTIGSSMAESAAQETARFQQAKAKALADKRIKDLQEKADSAPNEDAQQKASKAYYKALYDRMRKIDPGLKDRIDRTENATMKQMERKDIGGSNLPNESKQGGENKENKPQDQGAAGEEAQ